MENVINGFPGENSQEMTCISRLFGVDTAHNTWGQSFISVNRCHEYQECEAFDVWTKFPLKFGVIIDNSPGW